LSNLVLENSAASIAEKLKLPLLLTYMLPLLPTAELPSLMLPQLRLRALNRFTHTVFEALYWQSQKAQTNAWRAELGLPPANGAPRHQLWRMGAPILHAYSSAVVPRPADWSPQNILTGFWVMPQEDGLRACGAPTPELERWLAAGSAPIYLGYWRLPMLDVGAMLRLATQVAQTLGVRFVICAGRNAPDLAGLPVPDSIFVAESVDHGWLFPRCSATFHHGGAGTTAASLRAGLPMVISPLYADQPFWARRAEALGVGCTVPFQTLTAARLAQALRQVQDDAVRARARQLGAILQQEDGVAAAVRLIEERLPTAPILGR
jgi:sterol 3beta-glucosyltransferase